MNEWRWYFYHPITTFLLCISLSLKSCKIKECVFYYTKYLNTLYAWFSVWCCVFITRSTHKASQKLFFLYFFLNFCYTKNKMKIWHMDLMVCWACPSVVSWFTALCHPPKVHHPCRHPWYPRLGSRRDGQARIPTKGSFQGIVGI